MTTVRFYVQTGLNSNDFPWGYVVAEKRMKEVPAKGDMVVLYDVYSVQEPTVSQTLYGEVHKRQFEDDIVKIALLQIEAGHFAFNKP